MIDRSTIEGFCPRDRVKKLFGSLHNTQRLTLTASIVEVTTFEFVLTIIGIAFKDNVHV